MTLEDFLRTSAEGFKHGGVAALGVSLLSGIIASAVCPCTLPMGVGMAGIVGASEGKSRWSGVFLALSFFLGIVVNLSVLGAVAGRLGAVLTESFGLYWALGMAVISFAGALIAFSGPRLKVKQLSALRRPGVLGAFIYGFIFSLGTSAAPLLLLLTFSAAQAEVGGGLLLAFAFGVGRGLPFLVCGLFAGAVMRFASLSAWRRSLEVASGCALLFVSVYYARAFMAFL